MGVKIGNAILKFRYVILLIMISLTVFLAFEAKSVKLDYESPKVLPADHPTIIDYSGFKEFFGQDGFTILIGVKDKNFYTLDKIKKWQNLGKEFSKLKGVDSTFSELDFYSFSKNDSSESLKISSVLKKDFNSQSQIDSFRLRIRKLPFYQNTLFNDSAGFHAMLLTIDPLFFKSKERSGFVTRIKEIGNKYELFFEGEIYYTGMPFIKASKTLKVKKELSKFMVLSLIATILVLFFFFRSSSVVIISSIIVLVGVIWTLGITGLLGYKITVVMGLMPPLIIVIGIPNCVYLINKYQQLFSDTKDKQYALTNVISKIGYITLITNLTTAFGFGTFIFTNSQILFEFGTVAFIGIVLLFLITVLLVPIFLSFRPEPKEKHIRHLEKNWIEKLLKNLRNTVKYKKKYIFGFSIFLLALSILGMSFLSTSGKMTDDIPDGEKVKTDLLFVQKNLSGIMPFEIMLDIKRKNNLFKNSMVKRIDSVQNYLESFPEISKSTSFINILKLLNQTVIYDGQEEKYELPSSKYLRQIAKNIKTKQDEKSKINIRKFIDSTGTKIRITCQIKDVGVNRLEQIINEVIPTIDKILNPDKKRISKLYTQLYSGKTPGRIKSFDSLISEFPKMEYAYLSVLKENNVVKSINENGLTYNDIRDDSSSYIGQAIEKTYVNSLVTGATVPFARGTKYLIKNLILTLLIAILGISVLMFFLFQSFWIVLISLISNIIPLLFTAGLMGFFGVDLKPSTVLVFSISLGIAVDDAIHFLAKFKQELKANDKSINRAVYAALRETGVSMFYTSVILFFGFSVFIASSYGGTQALGMLVSVTLLVAMLSNLLLLPALLLKFEEKIER